MLLSDRIKATDDTTYWPLQVIIDTLAAAQNISLRCLSTSHALAAFKQQSSLGKRIRRHFASEQTFWDAVNQISHDPLSGISRIKADRKIWDDIFKIDPLLEWLVLPSFTSPLFVLMRESKIWSVWETIWCLNVAITNSTRDDLVDASLRYGAPFGDQLHLAGVRHSRSGLTLFAGPVWQPWPLELSEHERQESAKSIIEVVTAALEPTDRHFADGISSDRIQRNLLARAPLDPIELKNRTSKVAAALDIVLNTEVPEILVAAQEYESLALHALALANFRSRDTTSTNDLKIQLPRGRHVHDRSSNAAILMLHVEHDTTAPHDLKTSFVTRDINAGSEVANESQSLYEDIYYTIFDRTNINRSVYFFERINLIRLWLQAVYLARPIRESPTIDLKSASSPPQTLDRLSRRLMLLFGADTCNIYQYDTIQRRLIRRGSFVRDLEKGGNRDEDGELMRRAGSDDSLRRRSICYRCIDSGKVQFEANLADDEMLVIESQSPPRHVLVAPLTIHGRTWGAIEIQGLHPYQLLESSIRWANELTRAITPIIHDRLLLQKLSEMNNIVLGDRAADEKCKLILEDLAGLLLASSGALYIQHQRRTSEYECIASFGRKAPDGHDQLPGFVSDDLRSVSARLLREKGIGWTTGKIGASPFDDEWLSRPKNTSLKSDGHIHVAIFSLLDNQGKPFGSITLTSKSDEGFGPAWTNVVHFLSKHVGVLIESIKQQSDERNVRVEYQAHAVKTRVDRVVGGVKRIVDALGPFFDEDKLAPALEDFLRKTGASLEDLEVADALRLVFGRPKLGQDPDHRSQTNLSRVLEDLTQHAADLRMSAVYISGGENEEHPAHAKSTSWRGTWADLRGCLLSALKPLAPASPEAIRIPAPHELPWNVKLRIPPPQLQEILNNIVDNSYKYNHLPQVAPLITCRIDYSKFVVNLELRNMAPQLSGKELQQIGRPRFRAAYAYKRNADGVGLGLAFCHDETRRWGGTFSYFVDRPATGAAPGSFVWHRARLHFPSDCVRIEDSPGSRGGHGDW